LIIILSSEFLFCNFIFPLVGSSCSLLFVKRLLHWFNENKRDLPWRKESSSYKILIAEKLLQQTDVAHVIKVYDNFFNSYPTLRALADAKQEEIEETIKSLGFWRVRARDIKRMARF
jgi:A/G-specific adenine glycosylase